MPRRPIRSSWPTHLRVAPSDANLQRMVALGLQQSVIARAMQCHRSTVYRRRMQLGVPRMSQLSDEQVLAEMEDIRAGIGVGFGGRRRTGTLAARGIRVSRARTLRLLRML